MSSWLGPRLLRVAVGDGGLRTVLVGTLRDNEALEPEEAKMESGAANRRRPRTDSVSCFTGIARSFLALLPVFYAGSLCLPARRRDSGPAAGSAADPGADLGRITEVNFEGGDGKLISQGTTGGQDDFQTEIENQILTLDQQQRPGNSRRLKRRKSELSKLIAGYRDEKINAAQAKLDQAIEEVNVATQELAAAKVNDAYSSIVLPSYEKLYKSGAIAYLQYQEEIKKAGINKINVEKQRKESRRCRKKPECRQSSARSFTEWFPAGRH